MLEATAGFRFCSTLDAPVPPRLITVVSMNVFSAALNGVLPHFRVRGDTLLLSQGHPFNRTKIDLRQVAAHKLPSPMCLQIRLFRGRWVQYHLGGFRPAEVTRLRTLLTERQRQNHQSNEAEY